MHALNCLSAADVIFGMVRGLVISIEKGNGIGTEKGNTRYLIEIVSFSLLGVFVFLGLHGFAEAVTLAVHFEDFASVCEPIEQGGGHSITLEYTAPLAEGQVARHQQAPSFIAISKHLEEQFGTRATE
jgi:hypothetical protein